MKILWVTNIALPEATELLNASPLPYGGWLVNASIELSKIDDVCLTILFPTNNIESPKFVNGKKIRYYAFPRIGFNDKKTLHKKSIIKDIIEKEKPDIVNIFGTEFPHALYTTEICNELMIKSIITIQGLVSIVARHYTQGIPTRVVNRFTFRDLIRLDNLNNQKREFKKRGILEIQAIKNVSNVIGRTTFDRACTYQINPSLRYYKCNETLRDPFYSNRWEFDNCEKFSIFVSQGTYPIKGLHYMLEALAIVLKDYPDVKLYVGGENIFSKTSLSQKLRFTSYVKYINELIHKHNLYRNVIFTGVMPEEEMCERYLKSNVFVCPSTIENSPNSLAEAMIIGVPCIAADVGGVSDMMTHDLEGYIYPSDAPYLLAHYIREVFNNKEKSIKLSENARNRALIVHDRSNNNNKLYDIYSSILEKV